MDQLFLVKFLIPLFWAIGFMFTPERNEKSIKLYALIGSLVTLAYSIKMFMDLPDTSVLRHCLNLICHFSLTSRTRLRWMD